MKRVLDIALALLGLVLLAPFGVAVALLIVATSPGGALYAARRVGRGGATFTMWKLRTMRAVAGWPLTAGNDPRVTRIGRVLRATRIDELPQLWNVLRGEMSLVGPRPEDPSLVDLTVPRWLRVLSVRPGITGLTQLTWGPREARMLRTADFEAIYRTQILPAKLAGDLDYVARQSLSLDLGVLARTLLVPLRGER